MDLRKRRSMQFLWEAFFKLMTEEKRSFSTITVDQICDRAMIHRSTFYKHYDDKFKLLEYGLNQLMEGYWNIPLEKRVLKPFYWSNEFFKDSESYKLVSAQKGDELFFDCMTIYSMRLLKQDSLKVIQYHKTINVPHDLLANFYVSTMVTLSSWWSKNPNRVSLEQLDEYFHELVNENIFDFGKEASNRED
jgi:AcrR family transcriptional regulator